MLHRLELEDQFILTKKHEFVSFILCFNW